MDKDLEKILGKAKRGEPTPKTEVPLKIFPKNSPYDYLVFTKLVRFSGFNKFIFLILFPLAICIGFLFPGFFLETIYAVIIYIGIVTAYLLINWMRYHTFKGWQERLPFKLNGWNEMIHDKKMFCDLCWNHTRIEVVTTDSSQEILELIQAALTILSKKSQRAFYNRKTGSTSKHNRQDWKVISSCVAEGSANPEVMSYMKNVFEKELSIIAKKTGKIKSVNVSLLSEEFQIEIEISTGNT